MLKKIAVSFVLSIFIFSGLQAQTPIQNLQNGVLIVRLTSEYRKIEEMEQRNMSKKVAEVIAERDAINKLWIEAFSEHYDFSQVLFSYDTLHRATLENGGENCFLNTDFEIDSNLSLNGRSFLMFYHGNANPATGSGAEGWIFRDANFNDLKKPFPYFIKSNSLGYIMNKLFKSSIAEARNIERMVKKANRKLNKFYGKRA